MNCKFNCNWIQQRLVQKWIIPFKSNYEKIMFLCILKIPIDVLYNYIFYRLIKNWGKNH